MDGNSIRLKKGDKALHVSSDAQSDERAAGNEQIVFNNNGVAGASSLWNNTKTEHATGSGAEYAIRQTSSLLPSIDSGEG